MKSQIEKLSKYKTIREVIHNFSGQQALELCQNLRLSQNCVYPVEFTGHISSPIQNFDFKLVRFLLPYCSAEVKNFSLNFSTLYQPSQAMAKHALSMAKILVEEGECDPRTLLSYGLLGPEKLPLYQHGQFSRQRDLESNIKRVPEVYTMWQELDAYFKQKSFEFQQKTGRGVDGFPILQESDLQAA